MNTGPALVPRCVGGLPRAAVRYHERCIMRRVGSADVRSFTLAAGGVI